MSRTDPRLRAGDLLFAVALVAALYAAASAVIGLVGSTPAASATSAPASVAR